MAKLTKNMLRVAELLKTHKSLPIGACPSLGINSKSPNYVNQATADALVKAGLAKGISQVLIPRADKDPGPDGEPWYWYYMHLYAND